MLRRNQLIGANFSFQHYPFAFVAEHLHHMGFRRMELWGCAPHLDLFHDNISRLKEIKNTLRAWQLEVHCFTPEQVLYPINIASGDKAWREASVARFCHAADMAAELGARYLFLTPGRGFENEAPERAWEHCVHSISQIAAYAHTIGLSCLLEPLQRFESNIVNDVASLERIWHEINADNIDIVLDLVAMATAGDKISDYCKRFGERLTHVHIVDGTPSGHLLWGDGHLPLGHWLEQLSEHNFTGTMTFEPFGNGSYALDPVRIWQKSLVAIAPYLEDIR